MLHKKSYIWMHQIWTALHPLKQRRSKAVHLFQRAELHVLVRDLLELPLRITNTSDPYLIYCFPSWPHFKSMGHKVLSNSSHYELFHFHNFSSLHSYDCIIFIFLFIHFAFFSWIMIMLNIILKNRHYNFFFLYIW